MFSHMMVGANDIEESKVFYDAVLGTLGCKPGILSMNLSDQKRYMYIHEKNIESYIQHSSALICSPLYKSLQLRPSRCL